MKHTVIFTLLLCSCRAIYVPNARNTPMFSKAGEVQASVILGNGYDIGFPSSDRQSNFFDACGIDFQSAVSITDHVGFIGNYALVEKRYHNAQHWFVEGGAGYFKNTEKMFFEIFGGFGKGHGETVYEEKAGRQRPPNSAYNRYFIQHGFGWNKNINHLSFVTRLSVVDFQSVGASSGRSVVFFFEPAIAGKVNVAKNHLIIHWQTGLSLERNKHYPELYLDQVPFSLNVGLGLRVGVPRPLKAKGTD